MTRVILVGLLLGSIVLWGQAHAVGSRVLAADAWGLTLELTFPAAEIRPAVGVRSAWHEVHVPGLPLHRVLGAPVLPRYGVLIGIPEGARLALTLVEEDGSPELTGIRVVPAVARGEGGDAASWVRFEQAIDPALYGSDAWYPAAPVEPGFEGRLRGQAVAQILFHPVLYHPLEQRIRTYHRLRVRVSFDRPLASMPPDTGVAGVGRRRNADPSDPFGTIIRDSLINHHLLGR